MVAPLILLFALRYYLSFSTPSIQLISSLFLLSEAIYEQFGYHVLERTLKILIGTWEDDPLSLSANFLRGVAKLVVAFEDKLDGDYFKEKLGKESLRELSRNAKERKAGSTGYAEAMIIIYNKKNIAHTYD